MSQPTIIPTSLTLLVFHLPFEVGNSWVGKNSPIKIKVLCQKKKSLQNVCITLITAVGLEKNSSKLYITEPPSTPLCEVIGQPINLMLLSVAANRLRFLRSILLCADTLRADSLVLDWGRFRRRIPYRAWKSHCSLRVGSCSVPLIHPITNPIICSGRGPSQTQRMKTKSGRVNLYASQVLMQNASLIVTADRLVLGN